MAENARYIRVLELSRRRRPNAGAALHPQKTPWAKYITRHTALVRHVSYSANRGHRIGQPSGRRHGDPFPPHSPEAIRTASQVCLSSSSSVCAALLRVLDHTRFGVELAHYYSASLILLNGVVVFSAHRPSLSPSPNRPLFNRMPDLH